MRRSARQRLQRRLREVDKVKDNVSRTEIRRNPHHDIWDRRRIRTLSDPHRTTEIDTAHPATLPTRAEPLFGRDALFHQRDPQAHSAGCA